MRKALLYLAICVSLLMATFGTVSSRSFAPKAQDQDDPACRDACVREFQSCYQAAYPSKPEGQKCLAAYRHCIAHCK